MPSAERPAERAAVQARDPRLTRNKPRDVEEWIDVRLHRPVAALLVGLLAATRITPNQVTLLSGVVGLLSGGVMFCSLSRSAWWVAVGGGLLFCSVILDCADGQLARRRGEHSLVGRALDGMVDPAAPIAVFHGLGFFLMSRGLYPDWYVYVLGWSAGLSMVVQTNQYDHAKNVYLHNTEAGIDVGGPALLSPEEVERDRQAHLARRQYVLATVLWLMTFYTRGQRRWGQTKIEQDAPITTSAAERSIYRAVFRRSMRLWSLLGLGTHLALLVGTALLAPLAPAAISVAWWIFLLPANLLLGYLLASKPRLIAEYERRVAAGSAAD